MSDRKIRVGIMGLGQIGRHLYHLALEKDDIEIVAVADIGKPEIIEYLLKSDGVDEPPCKLQDNYLINEKFRTRMLQLARPEEVPWDVMNVDCVVDATGRYRRRRDMEAHLRAGAKRVILASLPAEPIDRIVIPGINEGHATGADKMISAGSATTNAFALLLQSLDQALGVDCASMTTVHAYTSDQSLQDYAHEDFRRSRSAAENIIPNNNESARWVELVLPKFAGKLSGYALNVPVQRGSLLDVNCVMHDGTVTVDQVNDAMRAAAAQSSGLDRQSPMIRLFLPMSSVAGNRCSSIRARPSKQEKKSSKCWPGTRAWGMRAACSTWSGTTASSMRSEV